MTVNEWIGTGPGRQARLRLLAEFPRDADLTEAEVRILDGIRVRQLRGEGNPELPKLDARVGHGPDEFGIE